MDIYKPINRLPFVGYFGQRELELCALKICEFEKGIRFTRDSFKDIYEKIGFYYLHSYGWMKDGVPNESFWTRIEEKQQLEKKKDRDLIKQKLAAQTEVENLEQEY